ncbi:MAG: hypothetical protein VKJ66_00270 [Synechococcus sp.]|nr:hypothetical protein [Synechococcus sp.]
MATTTTKESEVIVPEGQAAPIVTETPQGTSVVFGGQTQGTTVVAKEGTTVVSGEKTTGSSFQLGAGANLVFADYKLKKSDISGDDGANEVDAEGTVAKKASFELGGGVDSVAFGDGSVVKKSSINLGAGADEVLFSGGSKVTKTDIDLGSDSDADTIIIEDGADIKKLTLKNFGPEDELIIGGRTFTSDDIVDGKIPGFDFISFE